MNLPIAQWVTVAISLGAVGCLVEPPGMGTPLTGTVDQATDTAGNPSGTDADTASPSDTSAATGVAALVAGTYTGDAQGLINDTNFTVTVVVKDPSTVTVSGTGLKAFDVPLVAKKDTIQSPFTWVVGVFVLDDGELSITHTPQLFNFLGIRDST